MIKKLPANYDTKTDIQYNGGEYFGHIAQNHWVPTTYFRMGSFLVVETV